MLVVISLVLLAIPPTLRPGIEFTSGTTTLLRFDRSVEQSALRTAYADLGHPEARIQSTGADEFLIRTSKLDVPDTALIEVAPEVADSEPADPGLGIGAPRRRGRHRRDCPARLPVRQRLRLRR